MTSDTYCSQKCSLQLHIEDKISRYILNANRNLLITFGAFFSGLIFVYTLETFAKNFQREDNNGEDNNEEEESSSFLGRVALFIFLGVVVICLYHIYLVYQYQSGLNNGKIEYNKEWFFFPLFIILFTAIPMMWMT